jgi:adenylate cyclase
VSPERVLIVDDAADNIRMLGELLSAAGYELSVARSGDEALAQIASDPPGLVLLDVVMPGLSGYEVCERIRSNPDTRTLPVILVTGIRPAEERIRGLECGADDFLTKPVNREELLVRVRSMLRVQTLYRKVEAQARALAEWNERLEARVREQVLQLDRLGRLKDFFPPQVTDLIVAGGGDELFKPRRRLVTVCVADLRGFTPFSEASEPEDVMHVLDEYYGEMGRVIDAHGATVEKFAGDGMTIFLNAPLELADHEERAVRMALAMREAFGPLAARWARRGHAVGLGIGIASGYATIGAMGFTNRRQYAAIGMVSNLASRLCDIARDGEILTTSRLLATVEPVVVAEEVGERAIKGITNPVAVARITGLRQAPPAAA